LQAHHVFLQKFEYIFSRKELNILPVKVLDKKVMKYKVVSSTIPAVDNSVVITTYNTRGKALGGYTVNLSLPAGRSGKVHRIGDVL
jgi:hypothetical protein